MPNWLCACGTVPIVSPGDATAIGRAARSGSFITVVTRTRSMVARRCSLVCLVLLLVLIAWRTMQIPDLAGGGKWVLWALQSLPLLGFLPGLWRGRYRAYLWLCFALLMYFLLVVVRVAGPEILLTDIFELMIIVILFIAAMMYGRWRVQDLRSS